MIHIHVAYKISHNSQTSRESAQIFLPVFARCLSFSATDWSSAWIQRTLISADKIQNSAIFWCYFIIVGAVSSYILNFSKYSSLQIGFNHCIKKLCNLCLILIGWARQSFGWALPTPAHAWSRPWANVYMMLIKNSVKYYIFDSCHHINSHPSGNDTNIWLECKFMHTGSV